jgi:hypothetical protein
MRGGVDRSEVIVVSPIPLSTVFFTAFSPLPETVLTVDSGVEREIVRFDAEAARRDGVPVEVAVRPIARDLGYLDRAPHEYFYRLELSTHGGWMPARRDPESQDYRFLSTFLSFTGGGP